MYKNPLRLIIVFTAVFILPVFCFALELDSFKVCGKDARNLDYIKIHKQDLVKLKKKVWEQQRKNSITVEGSLFPSGEVSKVHYSLDGGFNFMTATGQDPFYFNFVPLDGNSYSVVVQFFNKREEVMFTKKINIEYTSWDWEKFFRDKIQQIINAYEDKDLQTFLSFIDDGEYPDFRSFRKKIQATFSDNTNLKLNIQVKSVEVEGDNASILVDWHKTFESDSYQSGVAQKINFKQRDKMWRISSLEDEKIFIVGRGRLIVFY